MARRWRSRKATPFPSIWARAKSFKAGTAPLELMVIGVARDMAAKNAFLADAKNAF